MLYRRFDYISSVRIADQEEIQIGILVTRDCSVATIDSTIMLLGYWLFFIVMNIQIYVCSKDLTVLSLGFIIPFPTQEK